VLLVLLAIGYAVRRPWSGDLGMHAATVERLRTSLTDPGNPLVDEDTPSPYYSPYTVLLALIARTFGWSALTTLAVIGPVNLALLLWGLRCFVRTLTGRRAAPVLAVVFLLLLWGLKPRVWSGFFSFWALPLVMGFPSTAALALTLLFWAALTRTLDRPPSWWRYLLLGLLASVIALTHQFTFGIAALGAIALVLSRARRLPLIAWAWLALAAAEAVVLLLVWPYYSFFALFGVAELDAIHRPLYDRPWLFYGLAVVALPALWLRARRRRLDPLVLLFAMATLVVAVGWFTRRYEFGRIWPGVLLAAQLALAVELAEALPNRSTSPDGAVDRPRTGRLVRAWLVVTALACLAGLAAQAGNLLYLLPGSMVSPRLRSATRMYLNWPDYSWITRYVHPGDVVLTNDYFGILSVPGYGARTVAPGWPDPMLPDEATRWHAVSTMINPNTAPATRRELLDRYHVRWVLEIPGSWTIDAGRKPVAVGPRGQRLYSVATG
jgi:alpha-1,6-mannosyltransferase